MSNEVKKHAGGRPTDYKPEYAECVFKLCLLGSTDSDLAVFFDVSEATINNWKIAHGEFLESIKAGKEKADAEIAESLYRTAMAGNTTAQIFWLKNRRPKEWRDKQEIDHTSADGSMSPKTVIVRGYEKEKDG